MGKHTKPLGHKDWFTQKAGYPTIPGTDDQKPPSILKLFRLSYFGVVAGSKFGPYPLDVSHVVPPYLHIIEEKLTNDGQICVVQDEHTDKILEIYVKNSTGIVDIFHLVFHNGCHIIDCIWPK